MIQTIVAVASLLVGLATGFAVARSQFASRHTDDAARLALSRQLAEASASELAEVKDAAAREVTAARTAEARAAATAERLTEENSELKDQAKRDHDVIRALEPVRVKLADLQEHLARLEKERSAQYGTLAEQMRNAAVTDERLRSQTEALVGALRTTSARGQWGELELRRVLEVSGLTRFIDFVEQANLPSETAPTGGRRPDVVVLLPGGKSIAIDAKVPLAAYLDAASIPFNGTDEQHREKDRLLAAHAKAVRGHIDTLADRQYWSGLTSSPEFTVMFIPTESLLGEALRADPSVMEYALARNIAPASPSSLLALLKTVATIWQQSTVTEEARELLNLGRELYARLGVLGDHMGKLGRTLTTAVRDYNATIGSWERQVVVTTRRFDVFDASRLALAPISQDSAQIRQLTAPELTGAPDPLP
ncbi:MAG: DNA recombination protein RmuC [Bifidobacteriaceae bacterium]|jgi:DNA recombination protein RmuC|nr:DNA recombination protein RmuC [Bifidobacteriaceae bacterium]